MIHSFAKRFGRRAFLSNGALVMSAAALNKTLNGLCQDVKPAFRFGLFTDTHYADRMPVGSRFYRESIAKTRECISYFNKVDVDSVVELGDLIDAADSVKEEIQFLQTIESELSQLRASRHYVLGNHCVWTLTKEQFLENSTAKETYYSFDHGDYHFIVLDACFRQDGVPYGNKNFEWTDTEIPADERDWLKADLAATSKRTIVFVHQRLDVQGSYGVKSAEAVRQILEASGKVAAVLQGHNHLNDHNDINGIHYCTLAAVIEGSGPANSAYSVLEGYPDGSLALRGFRTQSDYNWNAKPISKRRPSRCG